MSTYHPFKRSVLVGSDRCQTCGEVRTHVNHAYVSQNGEVDVAMMTNLHGIPYEHVQLIKGVALLLLCEKIADSQPPSNVRPLTAQQLVELWVRNAVKVLVDEGVFAFGKQPPESIQ
ncbi:MAG: hypothetical protein WAN50_00405 [Minisyncoccia bacterium]